MSDPFKSIIIYTDGACTGNPGPGGWAAIVATPEGEITELGGHSQSTTNNRMEIAAALRAIKHLPATLASDIFVYTDSTYLIRGITQWIWGWRSRGWLNSEGKEVLNKDLWEELLRQTSRLKGCKIHWRYVRGHTGNPGNERCDEIAVAFATGKKIELFRGPLIKYSVAIHDLPEDQELPAMRTVEKKEPAFSYLSFHGGVVMRHRSWAECERRVKGQSQAKFKKAKNQSDESEILKSWGLNPERTVIKE